MDSIKSKMKSLAEATQEATTRANVYEEETRRVNDVADKFEEQVGEIATRPTLTCLHNEAFILHTIQRFTTAMWR